MKKYKWNAKDYEKHSQVQQQWARELIAKLNLEGTEDILDLGCGDGKVTAEIARNTPSGSIVGVDNSSSMIELASERFPANKYPNLIFMVMDAVQLAFIEGFDVVFSNAALHWVMQDICSHCWRNSNQIRNGGRTLGILRFLTAFLAQKSTHTF
ncbi:MAG: class I SAM-dependent methyltransferase [Planctomycetota bacterium]